MCLLQTFRDKSMTSGALPAALRRAMVAKFVDFDKYQLGKSSHLNSVLTMFLVYSNFFIILKNVSISYRWCKTRLHFKANILYFHVSRCTCKLLFYTHGLETAVIQHDNMVMIG